MPVVSFAVLSKDGRMSLPEIRQLVDDTIKVQMQQVDGVGAVDIIGGLEREIQVEVDINRLNAQGLSIAQVSQAIRGENLNMPAGRVQGRAEDFLIRTKAEFTGLPEMLDIVVSNAGGHPVYLKDVAVVGPHHPEHFSDGRPSGLRHPDRRPLGPLPDRAL